MTNKNSNDNEDIGFYFHPNSDPADIGHPKLEINIHEKPTNQHFDPEEVQLWLVNNNGNIIHTKITHPYNESSPLQLGVGRVVIQDRKYKTVEAFIFGGELEVTNQGDYTHCILTSETPIMHLSDPEAYQTLVAVEFEVLLAQEHAAWGDNDEGFYQQLNLLDPNRLFAAGLVEIKNHLSKLPPTHTQRRTEHAVDEARQTLERAKEWPTIVPTLVDLFKY